MTDLAKFNVTTDPRINEMRIRESTTLTGIPLVDTRETFESDISELTERIETLTNVTGSVRVAIQNRPIKYSVEIRDLEDLDYQLEEPLLVVVEEYLNDEVVIASVPEFEVFGEGVTLPHALGSLKGAILDLYDDLNESDPEELNVIPKNWLRTMNRIILKQ